MRRSDHGQNSLALPGGGARIEGDRYYTPEALARAGVAAVDAMERIEGLVWEPHVGAGAWARAVADLTSARLVLSDLDAEAPGLNLRFDPSYRPRIFSRQIGGFLEQRIDADWIIGNPPYAEAEAHVRHALACAPRVVMLLRLAFLESAARIPFWKQHPARHIWSLAQRPSFTACGRTDSAAYGLFFWERGWAGPRTIDPCWPWKGA